MTSKPTRVGPYLLPAGVVVGTPLFALHNTKHNWERPLEFLPERWLPVPVEAYVLDGRALGAGGGGGSRGAAVAGAWAGCRWGCCAAVIIGCCAVGGSGAACLGVDGFHGSGRQAAGHRL